MSSQICRARRKSWLAFSVTARHLLPAPASPVVRAFPQSGVCSRPRLRLCGRRGPWASYTCSTRALSSSIRSSHLHPRFPQPIQILLQDPGPKAGLLMPHLAKRHYSGESRNWPTSYSPCLRSTPSRKGKACKPNEVRQVGADPRKRTTRWFPTSMSLPSAPMIAIC